MQYNFGVGNLFAIPSGSNPTPDRFGALQDIGVDFSFSEKDLKGQNQFPLDVARTGGKIAFKAKAANIDAQLFNDLFFGGTISNGIEAAVIDESGTIPTPTGPYTVTVTNSANFVTDLGVVYATTGVKLKRVASAPTTGQYSEAAGVYTFAATDAGLGVKISYTYTASSTGQSIQITNQLQGVAPNFSVVLAQSYKGKSLVLRLNKCQSSKLALPSKNEDHTIPEFDFAAMDDGTGGIGTLNISG